MKERNKIRTKKFKMKAGRGTREWETAYFIRKLEEGISEDNSHLVFISLQPCYYYYFGTNNEMADRTKQATSPPPQFFAHRAYL